MANKSVQGYSLITSLANEKVRSDEFHEKNYLEGNYEGVPKLNPQLSVFDNIL